jgi:hypothetical protein
MSVDPYPPPAVSGGGGAPTDADYIVGTASATLTQERVLTSTPTVSWDLTTPGQAKAVVPDASITEAKLGLTDVTTQNVSSAAHGLTPKLSGNAAHYLNGAGAWTTPPVGTTYTDEQAQDAVGAMLINTGTVSLTYGDGGPTLQADVNDISITEAKLAFVDVTTKDASTTAHGLLRKLSGASTEYLDGSGAWTTPPGGAQYWSRSGGITSTIATGLLAYWHLEEATGSRLDSVGANHLTPTGSDANVSSAAGKIGNALAMNGTNGTYLSVADNATLSAGPNLSFSVACWVYLTNTNDMGFVGKGTATPSSNTIEYMLWHYAGAWRFAVGSGTSFVNLASATTPVVGQWTLLIGWYDHVADIQYIQVNNGTPTQVANTAGSYDSTLPFEVGRTVGFASQSLNGRIDMPMFAKRVWTAQERTDLWNNGNGLAYPFALGARLSPSSTGDQVLLAGAATTDERLEVDGALKLGMSVGTTNGTLRWSGTDLEVRQNGSWVSCTGRYQPAAFLLIGA